MLYLAISYRPERGDYNTEALKMADAQFLDVSDDEPNKIEIKYSCSDNHLSDYTKTIILRLLWNNGLTMAWGLGCR